MADMQPWDQQEGEPTPVYNNFLRYRNLGASRSVLAAYLVSLDSGQAEAVKGRKKPCAPGNWQDDCANWRWVERAEQWDRWRLLDAGDRIQASMVELFLRTANGAAQTLATKPMTVQQALDAFAKLAQYAPFQTPDMAAAGTDTPNETPSGLSLHVPQQTG